MTKKSLITAGAALVGVALAGSIAFAQSKVMPSELHVAKDGKVSVEGAKVTAVSGNTISVLLSWGGANLAGNVQTDANTKFVREKNGGSSLAEIVVGDLLSIRGTLVSLSGQASLAASMVKDWSIREVSNFSGTVASIDLNAKTFVLAKTDGNVTVSVAGSAKFLRGKNAMAFADLRVNDKVAVKGVLNRTTNTVAASSIVAKAPEPRIFEGKVKSVASSTLPTTMVVTVGNVDHTVRVAADTSLLNKLWLRLGISGIAAGDTVRIYGAEAADGSIDATVIRDVK
jgi:hypothetical protein